MNALIPQTDARHQMVQTVLDSMESEHSKRAYSRALTAFLDWHTSAGMPPLSKAVVNSYKAYLASEGKSPAVINQTLSAIRKLVREAADNGAIDPVMAQGIANVKGVKSESLPAGRDIKRGELNAMLGVCDASPIGVRDAAILALMYQTGLRRSSIVKLNVEDYDSETGELKVIGAKGNKSIIAHVTGGAAGCLEDWLTLRGDAPGAMFYQVLRGGHIKPSRLTTQAVWHTVQRRAEQAGIKERISPHDFRRTFVGDLLDAGADIATVQKMAGHSSVETTARYDRRGKRARKKAAGLLHVPYSPRILNS